MIISNPSVLFLRATNLDGVRTVLTNLEEQIGIAETEDGEVALKVRSSGRTRRVPFSGSSITSLTRGPIIFEKKIRLKYDPPYDVVEPYEVTYYLVNSTQGDMLLIVAAKSVSKTIQRVLSVQGFQLDMVRLDTRVQEALLATGEFVLYGIRGMNQRERVGGRVTATARSPTTSIERSAMMRFVRSLGSQEDRALTWTGTETRPNLTFWVYNNGRILIRNAHVQEEWMLAIIDMIMNVMT